MRVEYQFTEEMNIKYARELRKNATDCERLLWLHLRAGRLQGYKFKRQQLLGNYIVDFVCFQTRLIVEADGGQHNEQIEYDTHRDDWLRRQGFTVLRFWNNDILTNTESVLAIILDACNQYVDAPSPQPLSRKGRGVKGAGVIQAHGADSALTDLMPAAHSVGFNNRPINTELTSLAPCKMTAWMQEVERRLE
jgi:very-short-patch-repair endonuclease